MQRTRNLHELVRTAIAMNERHAPDGSYAGIVRRTGAYLIDYVVMFVAFVVLQSFVLPPLRTWILGSDEWMKAGGFPLEAYTLLTISFPTWLYFACSEHSTRQATLGKRVFGLIVTDMRGDRIGFGRAMLRTVIKLLPWELAHLTVNLPTSAFFEPEPQFRSGLLVVFALLVIYPALVVLTRRHQGLHDLIAKTVVLHVSARHTPDASG
jgi:uncharacterized RDD family membrane protein YckC